MSSFWTSAWLGKEGVGTGALEGLSPARAAAAMPTQSNDDRTYRDRRKDGYMNATLGRAEEGGITSSIGIFGYRSLDCNRKFAPPSLETCGASAPST
jgi:hypothetical protein